MNPQSRVLVLRQPVGVTAAITPWNFPAAMMTRKLGPAMAAGCTSVVKPASATPLTAAAVLRAIEDAGAPPGVVNLITSRSAGMVADTLFSDPRVRKLSFTGSTEVGKDLIRRSADQVKRLSLELGGHAPVRDLRRRRPRGRGRRAHRLEVPQRRPDLRLREPHLRAERRPRRLRPPARREGDADGGGARHRRRRDDRPADRRRRGRQGRRARPGRDRPGARLVVGGERLTEGDFAKGRSTPHRARERDPGDADLDRGDIRPGRRCRPLRDRGRGHRPRQRLGVRARRVLPHARLRPAASGRREARVRHHRRQLGDHQRRERPVRRHEGVRATAARAAPSGSTSTST